MSYSLTVMTSMMYNFYNDKELLLICVILGLSV